MAHTVQFVKTRPDAVVPTRAHPSDIGYDLVAVSLWKKLSDQTEIYETGIAVVPPPGTYVEILPRSSVTKTGYMLANSVGVIDPHYTGSLKIAVRKVDDQLPGLEPPFCRFQMVLRQALPFEVSEIPEIPDTDRGDGAFGSTDK